MNLLADKMTIFPTFSIYKCTCGKAFQRERFHKHRQGLPEKEGQFHQRKDFVLFCPSCNKCTRNKAEFGDHTNCPYVSLSKPNMDCVLAGKAIPNLAGVIAKAAENKAKASVRGEQDPIEAMKGMFTRPEGLPPLTQELIEEHRREVAHDEALMSRMAADE